MRNIILGGIGVLWGGNILLSAFISLLSGSLLSGGNGYYLAGRMFAIALGALLFVAGLYYVRKGWKGSYGSRPAEEQHSGSLSSSR